MEGAGKLIEDDELREAMQEKGLGTPATRAAIIEGLINEKYMLREGRELIPTAKAFQLMTLLRGLGVEELSKPELTGEWEYKLAQMEHGKLEREAFMREIAEMTKHIVKKAKEYDRDTVPGDYATLADALPQLRRRGEGELPPLHLHRQAGHGERLRLLVRQDPRPAAPSSSPRSSSFCATRRSARWKASAPRPAGRSPPRSCSSSTTKTKNWKLEFDFGDDKNDGDRRARRLLRPGAARALPEVRRPRVRVTAATTSASTRCRPTHSRRRPATSRAARSSCSSRSSASR